MAARLRPLVAGNWKMNGLAAAGDELARMIEAGMAAGPPALIEAFCRRERARSA